MLSYCGTVELLTLLYAEPTIGQALAIGLANLRFSTMLVLDGVTGSYGIVGTPTTGFTYLGRLALLVVLRHALAR